MASCGIAPMACPCRIACALLALVALFTAGNGIATTSTYPATPILQAGVATHTLLRQWQQRRGQHLDWSGIHAWQRFEIIESLADYTRLSGDPSMLPILESSIDYRQGLDGNDDDLWAVIAALKVYALDHDPALLTYAQRKQQLLVRHYWDQHCGGGLWWDHARSYKNAITNELLIVASAMLYRMTGQAGYKEQALRTLWWFNRSGMINADNLVNDGLDRDCRNNAGRIYSYNQGVILGGLVLLQQITGSPAELEQARRMAMASIHTLTDHDGVLQETSSQLNQDAQSFKGIYIRYLGQLAAALPATTSQPLRVLISFNAERVWSGRRRADGAIDAYWNGPFHRYGAAAQAGGIDLFNAAALSSGGTVSNPTH